MGIVQVGTFDIHLDQTIGNKESGYKPRYNHVSMCLYSMIECLLMRTLLVYVGECWFHNMGRVMFGGKWNDDESSQHMVKVM